jgi:hypothetical protein
MGLEDLIIHVFCLVDDDLQICLGRQRLRERGPAPVLADSEVLTMEVIGEALGREQEVEMWDYFGEHWSHLFPALKTVSRTSFVRQAANLWKLKEWLWQRWLERIPCDPTLTLIDSFPVHVCRFARARRAKRLRGLASYGKDLLIGQTYYGLRVHVCLCWPGVITRFEVTGANVAELAVVEELTAGAGGTLIGDRNYWAPDLAADLRQHGLWLLAPFRNRSRDPQPQFSHRLKRLRYRIETVFSQLAERFHIKRLWAKDLWHLSSRLLRKVLSHTVLFFLNQAQGNPPLQFAQLLKR